MAEATHSDNSDNFERDVKDEEICVSSCPCGRLEWGLSASGIYFERRQAPCLPWCDSQYEKEDTDMTDYERQLLADIKDSLYLYEVEACAFEIDLYVARELELEPSREDESYQETADRLGAKDAAIGTLFRALETRWFEIQDGSGEEK